MDTANHIWPDDLLLWVVRTGWLILVNASGNRSYLANSCLGPGSALEECGSIFMRWSRPCPGMAHFQLTARLQADQSEPDSGGVARCGPQDATCLW